MTAQLFSKRKIVRAVKENMTTMCSANWKCILFSGDVCVGRGTGEDEKRPVLRGWQGRTGCRAPQVGLYQRGS